jgi:hypothetical protein
MNSNNLNYFKVKKILFGKNLFFLLMHFFFYENMDFL